MQITAAGLHGAHLRADLAAEFGTHRVKSALATGELRPLWRFVVFAADRWLDPLTRGAAALLLAGTDAALSGPTATTLHGCRALTAANTHITVRPGRTFKPRPGLVVHHCGMFTRDVVDVEGLRVLSLDRTVADLLCTARPEDALTVADEALRLAGPDADVLRKQIAGKIRRRLDPRGTVRGGNLLDLASSRSLSPAESRFRWKLVDAGFPLPEVNWELTALDGTVICILDLAWPSVRIAAEYDGYAAHAGRAAEDQAREEDLRRRGWIVVRASAADLASPERFERELRAAFAQRGYTWR